MLDIIKEPRSLASLAVISVTIVLFYSAFRSAIESDDYDFTISAGINRLSPSLYYFLAVFLVGGIFYKDGLEGLWKTKSIGILFFFVSLILLKIYPHQPVPSRAELEDKDFRLKYLKSQSKHQIVAVATFLSVLSIFFADKTTFVSNILRGSITTVLAAGAGVGIYYATIVGDNVSADDVILNIKLLAIMEYTMVVLFSAQLFLVN